jgi:hypothetical protein
MEIQWDPDTPADLTAAERYKVEDMYLKALDDPSYFPELYFNRDGNAWLNPDVRLLDVCCQYSKMHTSAERLILRGMDLLSARLARLHYNRGDTELGDIYLNNAVEVLAGILIAGYGSTGRSTPVNSTEAQILQKLLQDPLAYGRKLTNVSMNDPLWPQIEG